jgi:hypothetical protein
VSLTLLSAHKNYWWGMRLYRFKPVWLCELIMRISLGTVCEHEEGEDTQCCHVIAFLEVGYRSVSRAAIEPWRYEAKSAEGQAEIEAGLAEDSES